MNATERYLYGLRNRGSKYGLERMQRLVEALGYPQLSYPVIHVAGTNGKGSVCAMLESIYRHAGYRVGLLTSPHLVHLGERVQVDRMPLSDRQITAYVDQLRPVAESLSRGKADTHPTFFELIAAIGFLHFRQEQVDLAVIETGLGGRLDATNVVEPLASVITSIGLDHTEILGDTLAVIAGEKAGIIKTGRPVVLGGLEDEAETVIRRRAAELGASISSIAAAYSHSADYPETNLAGTYQRINAATASLTAEVLVSHLQVT
ncbi:MAG: Mur ligase family protein, partial [Verrucomicrobiota bacterium]